MKRHPLLILSLLLASVLGSFVHAQTVTLTPNQTVANGRLVPVLTWTSSPQGPTSCTASGGWSGVKAGAGTQTLPEIASSASYSLTCTWPGTTGSAQVTWEAPTTNDNGTPVTGLAGFDVIYGTNPAALGQTLNLPNPSLRTARVTSLSAGTWHFAVLAYNSLGNRSPPSNTASLAVTSNAPTASASTSITINPVPNPPTNVRVTVAVVAGDTRAPIFSVVGTAPNYRIGTYFGSVPVGTPCGDFLVSYRGARFHRVVPEQKSLWGRTSTRGLVAPCA